MCTPLHKRLVKPIRKTERRPIDPHCQRLDVANEPFYAFSNYRIKMTAASCMRFPSDFLVIEQSNKAVQRSIPFWCALARQLFCKLGPRIGDP